MGGQMKFKFILLFVLVCFSFLVVAQEDGEEILDLGSILGIGENITASGIDYITKETSEKKDTTINFKEENSFLKIGNNTFENIQPSSEEQDAFVKLDKEGKIIQADFMTNEKGGTYNFLGEDIFVPANSKVLFDEKNGLVIQAAEGSEFKEEDSLFDLKLIGENIKLPNGKILNSGELSYDSNGQAFLEGSKTAKIGGVNVFANKNLNVDFEGKRQKGNYVSFGENFYFGGSDSGEVVFEGENKYFKNMKEGDIVKMGLGDELSEIFVNATNGKSYSDVYCDNEFYLETGQLTFESDGARIFKRTNYDGPENSVIMDVYSSLGDYERAITIGPNSNFAGFINDGRISKESFRLGKYEVLHEGKSNVLVYDKEYTERINLIGVGKYLIDAQEIAKKKLIEEKPYCKEIINEACSKSNEDLDRYVANNFDAQRCYLPASKRSEIFNEESGYGNYNQFFEYYSILEGVTVPTWGTKEEAGRINELKIGLREICKVYVIEGSGEKVPVDMSVISSFLKDYLIIFKLLNQGLV